MGPAVSSSASINDIVLSNGGEMGERMRSFDWSESALGPVDSWPQSLRTSISTCINSRFAIVVWWGRELTILYNDAYRAILGSKHPHALGRPGQEVWSEIWHIIGPMLTGVMDRGEATWSDDLLLELERDGYLEEGYFTFSYSPIHDESGGIGGVFTPVKETTLQVIGERRLRTLRDLAESARASNAQSADEVCRIASRILANNPYDIPFAAFYLFSEDGREAHLSATSGFASPLPLIPDVVPLEADSGPWVFSPAARSGKPEVVTLSENAEGIPCGAWPVPPREAVVLPLAQAAQRTGFLILAVSPRRRLTEDYQSFLSLASGHVATAIAEAGAFKEERKRAEALAELDRAKTTFFSNVSHEFRTPLTLMLGPLEEMLAMSGTLPPVFNELATVMHRNGLRLQRMVNTLLDFSRIEAGRAKASYESTDLAALTADLAATFRSAIEKAGLQFSVECPPLPRPVYVDREMWEKVVLNLLSNAFKYTFQGKITIRVEERDGQAVLSVTDTGTGIPQNEMRHLFERFHRVAGARGRTQEGTGIGLALVHELVRLHSGSIQVESSLGQGSVFTVSLPLAAHPKPECPVGSDKPKSTAIAAEAFVKEALSWLPDKDAV